MDNTGFMSLLHSFRFFAANHPEARFCCRPTSSESRLKRSFKKALSGLISLELIFGSGQYYGCSPANEQKQEEKMHKEAAKTDANGIVTFNTGASLMYLTDDDNSKYTPRMHGNRIIFSSWHSAEELPQLFLCTLNK